MVICVLLVVRVQVNQITYLDLSFCWLLPWFIFFSWFLLFAFLSFNTILIRIGSTVAIGLHIAMLDWCAVWLQFQFILTNTVKLFIINFYKLILTQVGDVFMVTEKPSQISLSQMISSWKMMPTSDLYLKPLLNPPNIEHIGMQICTNHMKVPRTGRLLTLKS